MTLEREPPLDGEIVGDEYVGMRAEPGDDPEAPIA